MIAAVKRKYLRQTELENRKWYLQVFWEAFSYFRNHFLKQQATVERLRVAKGGSVMTQAIVQVKCENPPDKELSNTLVWSNFGFVPPKDRLRSRKFFCIDYQPAREQELVNWLKLCKIEAVKQRIPYLKIAVLVKYNNLTSGEAPRLATIFAKNGATIADYPESTDNFMDAVRAFNERTRKIVEETRDYSSRRGARLSKLMDPASTIKNSAMEIGI